MPSGYLHQRCARLASEKSGVLPGNADVLTLGAQGPDPLFTLGMFPLRLSSAPAPIGGILHRRRTGAFLRALCRRARAAGPVERDYALGFLTHYALDSTVHPYVYAHSDNPDGTYSSSRHMLLEKQWDGLYYRRYGGRGTPDTMPGVRESKAHWDAVATVLHGAIDEVFPQERFPREKALEALAGSEKANGLTHSPWGVKYALVWLLERLIGKPRLGTSQMTPRFPTKRDIENTTHQPWRNPADTDRVRTEGLTELYSAAVDRAAELLGAADAYFRGELDEDALAAIIGNAGYGTGMESLP